jgi:hypothetical protein
MEARARLTLGQAAQAGDAEQAHGLISESPLPVGHPATPPALETMGGKLHYRAIPFTQVTPAPSFPLPPEREG